MHGVTVEMRNRENNICLRGQGHWNESVSFSRESGDLQQHFGEKFFILIEFPGI